MMFEQLLITFGGAHVILFDRIVNQNLGSSNVPLQHKPVFTCTSGQLEFLHVWLFERCVHSVYWYSAPPAIPTLAMRYRLCAVCGILRCI